MGGFKALAVLLFFVALLPFVLGENNQVINLESGSSVVISVLEGSGIHIMDLPEDSVPYVKGALYLKDENTLKISVGSTEKAVVVYEQKSSPDKGISYFAFAVIGAVLFGVFFSRQKYLFAVFMLILVLVSGASGQRCYKTIDDENIVFSCEENNEVNELINLVLKDYNSVSDARILAQDLGMMDRDFLREFVSRIDEPGMKKQVHSYLKAIKQGNVGIDEDALAGLKKGSMSYEEFVKTFIL